MKQRCGRWATEESGSDDIDEHDERQDMHTNSGHRFAGPRRLILGNTTGALSTALRIDTESLAADGESTLQPSDLKMSTILLLS